MRILLFIHNISCTGGSERAVTVLANKLSSLGYEITLLSWMGGSAKPFFELDPKIEVKALYQNEVNIYTHYLGSLRKYYQVVNQVEPNYIIDVCTALSLLSVPLRLFKKFKLISWEHFNTSVNWNVFTPRLARWMVAKFANQVVVLTQTDKANYEKSFSAKNVICIVNPITITSNLPANLNSNCVLSIGRFTPQKGYDLLLNSWKLVLSQLPNLRLRIVGDGEQKENLLALAKKLEIDQFVDWCEPTSQIEKYYQDAALYVMSSRFEGLPFVLIEAKSFGLPIISFDCETGPREIVRHLVDGILVPAEDVQALANEIVQLMQNETRRKEYGANALKDLARFNLDEIVSHWTKLLK